jgi:hypothetical protein
MTAPFNPTELARKWADVELRETRSGLHHLSTKNGKPMLCGRTMASEMDEVYESSAELAAMLNEPANARYLCAVCGKRGHLLLRSITEAERGGAE